MVEKSLNIKQFLISFKPKVETIREFECNLGIVGKSP
jgi:hypothetical protein